MADTLYSRTPTDTRGRLELQYAFLDERKKDLFRVTGGFPYEPGRQMPLRKREERGVEYLIIFRFSHSFKKNCTKKAINAHSVSSTVFQKARSPMRKLFGLLFAPLLLCSSLFASSSKEGWGVPIPPDMFQADLYYSTETEGKVVKSVWKVRVEPNAIVARAEKGKNSTEAIFSKSLNLYRFVDIDETNETTIKREGSNLIATVKNRVTGKETKKRTKSANPTGSKDFIGMKGFLLSKDNSCEFYVLHIDDLSVREMIAKKEGTKTIQLGDRSVAQKKCRLPFLESKAGFGEQKLGTISKATICSSTKQIVGLELR